MTPAKLSALQELLRDYQKVLVAFSGGVDSTFLLKVAHDTLGQNCHAVTCRSITMAKSEMEDARRLGAELGLGPRHHILDSNELAQPGYKENPTDRCALCKTELMDLAMPLAEQLGDLELVLGTNTDDLGDYRPGIAAAKERGAKSPMVEVDLNKQDIRDLSRQMGLRTWNKPQLACLSSRFPYGTEITAERLERVDCLEDELRSMGFDQLRVRFHDTIARIELPEDDIQRACQPALRARILQAGKRLGFTYVVVDLKGFRSGSLNEVPLIQLARKAQ